MVMFLFNITVFPPRFHSTAMYASGIQGPSFCSISVSTKSSCSMARKGFSSISIKVLGLMLLFITFQLGYRNVIGWSESFACISIIGLVLGVVFLLLLFLAFFPLGVLLVSLLSLFEL